MLTALSLWLLNLSLANLGTPVYEPWLDNTLGALSYAPVGALVASRRPANPVGWLVCLYGFVISLSYFCAEYAIYALMAEPGSLPAGEAAAWVLSWILPPIIGLTVFPLLLFPTGRLPGRRWRWLAWLTAAWMLLAMVTGAFASGAPMGVLGPIQNPLGIEALTSTYVVLLLFVSTPLQVAAAFSLFVRLRRAVGVERQQIKWFAYAAAATISGVTFAYFIPGVMETPTWFERAGFCAQPRSRTGHPDLRRDCDPSLPSLRHRHHHQPHPRLRCPHGHAPRALLRGRGGDARDLPCPYWPGTAAAAGRGGLHARP